MEDKVCGDLGEEIQLNATLLAEMPSGGDVTTATIVTVTSSPICVVGSTFAGGTSFGYVCTWTTECVKAC